MRNQERKKRVEVDMIHDLELQEYEAEQLQHLGSTELLPLGSSSEDINMFLDQAQQSCDTLIVKETHWQPERMKTEQVVETKEPTYSKYVIAQN